ncbi:MAG: hypothetical protein WKH64_17225 [Chloroflexia bacterium]
MVELEGSEGDLSASAANKLDIQAAMSARPRRTEKAVRDALHRGAPGRRDRRKAGIPQGTEERAYRIGRRFRRCSEREVTDGTPADGDAHVADCFYCQTIELMGGLDVNLTAPTGVAAQVAATQGRWRERRGCSDRQDSPEHLSLPFARVVLILASAAVLAVGVVFTQSTGQPWVALLAPALAGAGVAYAYGPGVNPAFELSQSMAVSDRMILLVRALAVFGMNAVLGIAASVFAAPAVGLTLYWLIPMTMVAALALAAATLSHSANVGVGAALAGWAVVVLGGAARTRDLASAVSDQAPAQAYLIGTTVFIVVTLWASSGRRERMIGQL